MLVRGRLDVAGDRPGGRANQSGPSAVLMAGLIAVPQVITALISPWVGYHSERFGRKPLLADRCARRCLSSPSRGFATAPGRDDRGPARRPVRAASRAAVLRERRRPGPMRPVLQALPAVGAYDIAATMMPDE